MFITMTNKYKPAIVPIAQQLTMGLPVVIRGFRVWGLYPIDHHNDQQRQARHHDHASHRS